MPRLKLDPFSPSGVSAVVDIPLPRQSSPGYVVNKATGLIAAGTNVTLDGNGTDTSPYVINATGGGSGGTTSDATTVAKGIVQLAGDLSGTAAAPTVPSLTTKAPLAAPAFTGNATFDGTTLDIDATNHRVGMGTAAPGSLLHMKSTASGLTIENTSTTSKAFVYLTDNTSGNNFFEFDVNSSGTGNTNLLSIPNSGLLRSGAGSTGGMLFVSQATGAPIIFATGGFANANERMRIDSTGAITTNSTVNGRTMSTDGTKLDGIATGATANSPDATLLSRANHTGTQPESSVTNLVGDLASKAPMLNPTAVKTANYTAAANDFVPVNTTGGAIVITLPTAPADGTRVAAKIVILGAGNTLTLTAGGSDVFNKTGGSTSVTLSLSNQAVQYQYSAGIWYGVASDIGLTALDARYKAFSPRVTFVTSSATPTPNADTDDQYNVTALAAGATFGAPTGTPTAGQKLVIRIKDNATARTLSWNAIYRAIGVTLPTTTVISKTLYIGCIYNSTDTKWDVVAVVQEA